MKLFINNNLFSDGAITMTLITYRNSASPHNQHAIVPTMFYADLVDWLLSGLSRIGSIRHHISDAAILPEAWPSYGTCVEHMKLSELMAG